MLACGIIIYWFGPATKTHCGKFSIGRCDERGRAFRFANCTWLVGDDEVVLRRGQYKVQILQMCNYSQINCPKKLILTTMPQHYLKQRLNIHVCLLRPIIKSSGWPPRAIADLNAEVIISWTTIAQALAYRAMPLLA